MKGKGEAMKGLQHVKQVLKRHDAHDDDQTGCVPERQPVNHRNNLSRCKKITWPEKCAPTALFSVPP